MKKKFLVFLMLTSTVLSSFTGCGFSIGNVVFGTEDEINKRKEKIATEEEIPELEEDAYYVLHKGKFTPIYFGNSSFDEGEVVQEPSTSRLLWYIDDGSDASDFDSIPTLYKDDQLVYRYSDTLEEEFNFERFYDLGRSFGIYGLSETKSGRYSLTIDPELMYPDSDVYTNISTLASESVIIEQIETMKLRSGQGLVSDYGTISNFATDKDGNIVEANPNDEYKFLVYSGTYKNTFTFKPTYRILGSYEDYISYDYSFIDDDLIEITIPAWFQSGYYLINGVGVIRYINGYSKDYNSKTLASVDLNIPTSVEGLEGNFSALSGDTSLDTLNTDGIPDIYGDHSSELLNSLNVNDNGQWEMDVTTPGAYNITINLEITPIEGIERDTPSCSITSSAGESFYFSYDEESYSLSINNVYLPMGVSTFDFNDLTGITPTFNIEKSE